MIFPGCMRNRILSSHGDRHQECNARALEEAGVAKVILQKELTGGTLAAAMKSSLQYPEAVAHVQPDTEATEIKTAAEQIVDVCLQLARDAMPKR